MSRAFGTVTGHSAMRYVRGRRLTEAAKALAAGASDILSVALEAGYGSHEAFTRAFRDQFGLTPESVRAQRHLDNLALLEPITMDDSFVANLEPPRLETGKPLLIAGLGERYTCETSKGIPPQWQRFLPHFGNVPGQIGRTAYGVCCNTDEDGNFDYICGVEVASFSDLPPELQPRARPRAALRRVLPPRPHLDDPPHREHDLEPVAAGIRPRSRRRARTSSATATPSIPRAGPAAWRSGYRSKNNPTLTPRVSAG